MTRVCVTVPATSANLGPGFDSLGLALQLHNRVTFSHVSAGLTIEVSGEGATAIPTNENNLVYQAAQRLFQLLGRRPAGLHIKQHNCVPTSSGLGSSASAVVAGLVGANALVDGGLTPADIVDLAAEMEGHADNVAPAVYGGLVLCNKLTEAGHFHIEPIPIPDYKVVVVLPDINLLTKDARALLPVKLAREDVVFNIGRMGLLIRALMVGDFELLRLAMQDRIHQPYRAPLIPGFAAAQAAANSLGPVACALSGAGPGIIMFAPGQQEAIGAAVQAAFAAAGVSSRVWILPTDQEGYRLETA